MVKLFMLQISVFKIMVINSNNVTVNKYQIALKSSKNSFCTAKRPGSWWYWKPYTFKLQFAALALALQITWIMTQKREMFLYIYHSPVEAPHTGWGSVETWKGLWPPAAIYSPRVASSAETDSLTGCKRKESEALGLKWLIYASYQVVL